MADTHIKAEDITILPPEVQEKITNEVAVIRKKGNVTEELIQKLKEEYGEMDISGQEDKEGYLNLQTARKTVKNIRVAAEKLFDEWRAPIVAAAQMGLENKKAVVKALKEIEEPLQVKEKAWEAERDRVKAENAARIEQQGIARMTEMIRFGASLIGPYWVLGDVQYEAALVKEADEEIFKDIRAEFQAQFEINDAARIKKEEDDAAAALLFKKQQDEIAEQQRLLREGQEALRLQQEQLENQKKEQAKASRTALTQRRMDDLVPMGLVYNAMKNEFSGYGVIYAIDDFIALLDHPEEVWKSTVESLERDVNAGREMARIEQEEKDAKAEEKRLKDIEDAKILATGKSRRTMLSTVKGEFDGTDRELGALADDQWTITYDGAKITFDKEEKRIADEAEQERLAKLGDKAAWEEFLVRLKGVKVPAFKSGQYRALGNIAKERLEKIVSLQIAK